MVPVIQLRSNNAAKELVEAFRTIGFAYLEGHDITSIQLERTAKEFFAKPLKEKMQYSMKKSGHAWRGYFPVGDELTSGYPDQKEGFYFGVDHPPNHPNAKLPTFGSNPWPNKQLQAAVTEYMAQMKTLATHLMSLIASGLKLEEDFFKKAFTNEPTEFFRIFGYPPSPNDWGVQEHTDMGILTILKQDNSGGLQAKMLNGEWTDVPPRENAFVLNIGDMLEFWTSGILRSTPHRVRHEKNNERFSYPYFFDPNWNASLKPIDPAKLAHFPKTKTAKRWDGLELHALSANSTYGDFVWKKISKVFPQLVTA